MSLDSARIARDELPNLPNLRDLGGLCTDAGGRTRPGVLLRSAAPLVGDRRPELAGWPPLAVLDLRGTDELDAGPPPQETPGTTVHALPLLDFPMGRCARAVDWSEIPDLVTAYRTMLARGGAKLARILELVNAGVGPILVHCAAGKDRTGVVVAVLLRAAGVSRVSVIEDYRRTEAALPVILARAPAQLASTADPTHARRLLGSPAEAVTAALDELDGEPGGAAG